MRCGLIAKKLGMTSAFLENGKRLTLTLLKVNDCVVLGNKTKEKDGYNAVVVASSLIKQNKVKKPQQKLFSDLKIAARKSINEFRVNEASFVESGVELKADHFEVGQAVDVSGVTIGKGFAGAMKRHGFGGLRASHGVSISHRAHGSTGGCQDPGRVFKNKKMAGQMGTKNVTIQNLYVYDVDTENNILAVVGSVPGSKGGVVTIKDAVKESV